MDFSLSEEQEMFRGYVNKYLNNVGHTKTAREFIKGETESYKTIVSGLAELGFTIINISE